MLPTTIRSPPSADDYTPLADYQSSTPETFVGGKPVLHFALTAAKAQVPRSHCGSRLAIFPADAPAASGSANGGDTEDTVERTVDVWVNSENFTLFCQDAEAGVSIPYPSISIHAVKQVQSANGSQQAVWMQLDFADGGADDDNFETIELTIIPAVQEADPATETPTAVTPAAQLYETVATCSNLHPDPNAEDEDEEEENYDRIVFEGSAEGGHEALEGFSGVLRGAADGGLPPPMPGSGGWITAENVHEYFDEQGNWIGGEEEDAEEAEELGEGAGRTRAREEVDGDGTVNGSEEKRARVD